MTTNKSSYAQAGVNIDAGNRSVELIKSAVTSTHGPEVLAGIGSFGGLYSAIGIKTFNHPILVASTDGVGTKVMLCTQNGQYVGIGKDIVNHCVNDILVQGAFPLFFMDYFASSSLNPDIVAEVVKGMAEACRDADCALLGGETAEMPGVYQENHFDIVGTIVGILEKALLLPRLDVKAGDLLVGLASSGPHTNGYSLIRKVFNDVSFEHIYPELGEPLGNILLEPHRSYLPVLKAAIEFGVLKGLAHITGGGFIDNIPRILPQGCGARIYKKSWEIPPIFQLIEEIGKIDPDEMYRVFNMGIGMVAVIEPQKIDEFQSSICEQCWIIGEVSFSEGVILE